MLKNQKRALQKEEKSRILDPVRAPESAVPSGVITAKMPGAIMPKGDTSVRPPQGIDAIYSLRITQARRATAYRDEDFIRLLTIAPDHDATYGRK